MVLSHYRPPILVGLKHLPIYPPPPKKNRSNNLVIIIIFEGAYNGERANKPHPKIFCFLSQILGLLTALLECRYVYVNKFQDKKEL